jgi:hypothetical protein
MLDLLIAGISTVAIAIKLIITKIRIIRITTIIIISIIKRRHRFEFG